MAAILSAQKGLHAEESAEVEVLSANLEKLKGLTKRIQGSVIRLQNTGDNAQDSVGPAFGNTQRIQTSISNVDRLLDAIERMRAPLDNTTREERIIKQGPKKTGLNDYIASIDRMNRALGDLKRSNLKSNHKAVSELSLLLKMGNTQLEDIFRSVLREDNRPVEPLHYITKQEPFPAIPREKISTLRTVNSHCATTVSQTSQYEVKETPTSRAYAETRGDYISTSLQNLSAASMSTARKTNADALYRQGACAIGTYAQGIEGMYVAEYDNICNIFAREDWSPVLTATCQASLNEFSRTLRDLNAHVQAHLITDCYLGFEIVDVVSTLYLNLESRTGELKRPISDALKPVRDTAKLAFPRLLDDVRSRIQSMSSLPPDGGPVPIVAETMTRLQTMTSYMEPITSLMRSLGDGGWSTASSTTSTNPTTTSTSSLKSFDVGADGRQLFQHYATDTLETLLGGLDSRARAFHRTRALQGVFLANAVAIVDRAIRQSDLARELGSSSSSPPGPGTAPPPAPPPLPKLATWRRQAEKMYTDAWQDAAKHLLDVQHTTKTVGRPASGGPVTSGSAASAATADSAAIVKALNSKERDAIKEKFRAFNAAFDELVQRHRTYRMEGEVRAALGRAVEAVLGALYARFWDRYHEIDKGKGKYVKWDKGQMNQVLGSLAG
ncbi:MAG: exocyst complex component exo70 [Bathelium mastoideum]|nr:MAG: exocyst complex component exo70 [Bathelium mastoideum]